MAKPKTATTRSPLPFALNDLELKITTTRSVRNRDEEFDTAVTTWDVDVIARDLDTGVVTTDVAQAQAWVLDPFETHSVWEVLDSETEEHEMLASAICGPGGGLKEDLECWGWVICLDRVGVAPEYRGHGIGPLVGALTISNLRGGGSLAICYPAPIEDLPSGVTRPTAIKALV